MFKVTWISYGELDYSSKDFCRLDYDISNHIIFYETCNGIKHALRCDFESIFDKIHSIVSSEEFQGESLFEDGCDGDWYKFEYSIKGEVKKYEGYIYGLKLHEEVVSLIESCAKSILEDERKILKHNDINTNGYNIGMITMEVTTDFIRCSSCGSIINNKYYKNRKYWGRVRLSDGFSNYEVEYESGECPVCGQLNTELPDTGIKAQPDDSLVSSDGVICITAFEDDKDKLYSATELNDLLKYISDDDRNRIEGCQFKLFEDTPYDDSGDVYYYITIFKDGNEIGKIDMQYHSNTYFDLVDMEIKTTDDTPYYSYEMTLYEDSKEESRNIKNPFDDSIFKCKKCGKIFCTCDDKFGGSV